MIRILGHVLAIGQSPTSPASHGATRLGFGVHPGNFDQSSPSGAEQANLMAGATVVSLFDMVLPR